MTDSVSQIEVVTLAVYLLGGGTRAIDTEDVAVKANELAPGRFVWRKHKSQINLELVRVFLSDAKKAMYGRRVEGSGKSGWSLTRAGLEWAARNERRVQSADLSRKGPSAVGGGPQESRIRRERARLMTTAAWRSWIGKDAIGADDAAEVFRIDAYAVGRIRSMKVARLQGYFSADQEIAPFLRAAEGALKPEER